jgi:methyl-accepting chemotaxis protein
MKNLKVSIKLIISFMIIVILAVIVGVIGIVGMSRLNAADDALFNEHLLAVSTLGELREGIQEERVIARNYILNAQNAPKLQELNTAMAALEKETAALFKQYDGTITLSSLETNYFTARKLYEEEFSKIKRNVYQSSLISAEDGYEALFNPAVTETTDAMVRYLSDTATDNSGWAQETVHSNTALFMSMLTIQIIILAVTVVVALFFTFYISGLISTPLIKLSAFMNKAGSTGDISITPDEVASLDKMAAVKDEIGKTVEGSISFIKHVARIADELETIANGDLTANIELLSANDTMGKSLKQVVENLNSMFGEIHTSTNQVSSGSKQVADGAQALAQGATEQAASIQQLSSSIADIAESTKANAETAEKASKLSNTIKNNAENGSHQMDEMIVAVKAINEASQSISKIIKTIDDIAFQTNILALNAAVEAARAGQHGKGFAVVAEEVRNLASKSAEAARDTGDMIQDSMDKAQLGSRIAGETASSLKDIVSGINESSALVNEIARASEAQSMGIVQINIGVEQVAQVVQQNSATAQESAAASQQLSGQSTILEELITQFKTKNAGNSGGPGSGPGRSSKRLATGATGAKVRHASSHETRLGLGSAPNTGDFGKY